ncbi:MAG: inositol monophosphatase [Myxococcales bacterium]|nr:inositol monophosphatase [Myxococcales bacterium]
MTDPLALRQMAEALDQIAARAAAVLSEGYRGADLEIEHKDTIDLVTRFDRESEAVIRRAMAALLPGVALVAEEGGGTAPRDGRPVVWADPLDGTTNFAHGHPFFAVSLGLAVDGVAVAGVVSAPALQTVWRGLEGEGSTRNGAPCRVSSTESLQRSLLATGFPYDNARNPEPNFREFAALTQRSQGVRRCGSAALDLCLVADGTYDAYWERYLKPWDVAAGLALVRAAGGTVTAFPDGPVALEGGSVIASNGRLHAALTAALRAAR